MILQLSVSKAACSVTGWVLEKNQKIIGHEQGSKIARFVINRKTLSQRAPMWMTALSRKINLKTYHIHSTPMYAYDGEQVHELNFWLSVSQLIKLILDACFNTQGVTVSALRVKVYLLIHGSIRGHSLPNA